MLGIDCQRTLALLKGFLVTLFLLRPASTGNSNPDMQRLYDDMMINTGYNKLVRPRHSLHETSTVLKMGVSLLQLLRVDEKNQVMRTKVRVYQEWRDHKFQWNPAHYGNISVLIVPPEDIWIPDIVLYNSANEDFLVSTKSKVRIHYNGRFVWNPPATLESLCEINVAFFPFDIQTCHLKMGTWTYDGTTVLIHHNLSSGIDDCQFVENGINLSEYSNSTEWDILEAPAQLYKVYYPCCPDHVYLDIKFYLHIRRKPLFYISNLLIPCLCICSVTILVFYIPAQSAEKVTLGITVLNTLTVFLLLVVDICPPTSKATPLIGKYLVFTMVLLSCSLITTVLVLNTHFQAPVINMMPSWVRFMFIQLLPRLLFMRQPPFIGDEGTQSTEAKKQKAVAEARSSVVGSRLHSCFEDGLRRRGDTDRPADHDNALGDTDYTDYQRLPQYTVKTMVGVSSIASHLRQQNERQRLRDEWHFAAYVLDRLFLWLFTAAFVFGTLGILHQSPLTCSISKTLQEAVVNCSSKTGVELCS